MRILARCWPLLIVASGAAAQPAPPGYNPRSYCVDLGSRTGARSERDIASCLEGETRALAALGTRWGQASGPMRARCLQRNLRHSYDLLNICLETELERAAR